MIGIMSASVEYEREQDGRWLAEVPALPGVLAYGGTVREARARAQALMLRVLAEQIEFGEMNPEAIRISSSAPRKSRRALGSD